MYKRQDQRPVDLIADSDDTESQQIMHMLEGTLAAHWPVASAHVQYAVLHCNFRLSVARGAGVKPQAGKQAKIFLSASEDMEDFYAARQAALACTFTKFHRPPRSSRPASVQLQASAAVECVPEQRHVTCTSTGVATDTAELSEFATIMEGMVLGSTAATQSACVGTETATRSMFLGT